MGHPFWDVNWPIMKMGLQFVTPLLFAATRMFLGALCLFAFLALKGSVRLPGRGEIPILVSVAVFQIALPTELVHIGPSFTDAGRSAIWVFTILLWVAPIAFLALGERLTRMNLVRLAMGLAGIAVLFNPLSFYF
jgi:drug/metabolite transporter (DMT)-like permease